jgi:hypothetical protein
MSRLAIAAGVSRIKLRHRVVCEIFVTHIDVAVRSTVTIVANISLRDIPAQSLLEY